jgi:hypothetical protein
LIRQQLTTNADKKNVCLTCKQMQTLMTPLLYRNMDVFAERLDQGFSTTLNEDHPGLSHVRSLRIRSLEPRQFGSTSRYDENQLQTKIICRLLHTVPKHFLTRFEYDNTYTWEKKKSPNVHLRIPNTSFIGAGIMFVLRLRQTNICNYQLFSALNGVLYAAHLDWDMIAPAADELAHVTCLQIYFSLDDYDQIDRANLILARTPALQYLDIELENCDFDEQSTCCDSGAGVVRGMFRSRINAGQPTKLKSLRIASMCLLHAGTLLLNIVDFSALEHLQFIHCIDIDPFLRTLIPFNLNLSSLLIEGVHRWDTAEFAVSEFIRSVKPLKNLSLKFSGIDYSQDWVLRPHYSSLESLRIDADPLMHPITLKFKGTPCPNLEQLALFGFKLEERSLPSERRRRADGGDIKDLLVRAKADRHVPSL